MFIENHTSNTNTGIVLNFVKSLNVQAYPCGRRRAFVELEAGTDDGYYIPFDPEARLNTEANNRRHSSLNGFDQTYLTWDDENKKLTLALSGYLFNIKVDGANATTSFPAIFGNSIETTDTNASAIYANILTEETPLFSSNFNDATMYYTEVLRDQTDEPYGNTSIDCLSSTADSSDAGNPNKYYFAGLSFSTQPLTPLTSREKAKTRNIKKVVANVDLQGTLVNQWVTSLRILEKVNGVWQIHQPALLPKVEHGDTESSVKVDTMLAKNIQLVSTDTSTGEIKADSKKSVPALDVVSVSVPDKGTQYQLQFLYEAPN